MTRLTIVFGAFLVLLGIAAYAWSMASEHASVTALIPAFFGAPIALLGLAAARWPHRRALLAHVAVVLAALGAFGAGRGLLKLPALVTGSADVARPAAVVVQSIMAIACVVYVVLAVRSFIAARRGGA